MSLPAAPLPELRFVAAAFNALSAHIAILNVQGVVAVNRAWREFRQANGGADSLSLTYLQVSNTAEGALKKSREALAHYAKVSHHDMQEPLHLMGY